MAMLSGRTWCGLAAIAGITPSSHITLLSGPPLIAPSPRVTLLSGPPLIAPSPRVTLLSDLPLIAPMSRIALLSGRSRLSLRCRLLWRRALIAAAKN